MTELAEAALPHLLLNPETALSLAWLAEAVLLFCSTQGS
jgi:hypothetical protein